MSKVGIDGGMSTGPSTAYGRGRVVYQMNDTIEEAHNPRDAGGWLDQYFERGGDEMILYLPVFAGQLANLLLLMG